MFLNCGEFLEITSDLLATYRYLFNDLSKTFTNVLRITKFYKNYKKNSSTPELGKLRAACRSFFCSSTIFSGKIVCLRTCRLFFIFAHQCFWGNLDPHLPKREDCVKKTKYHWSSRVDYVKKFISLSLNQSKTIDLEILRKM